MNWRKRFDGFEFYNESIVNEKIQRARPNWITLILDGHLELPNILDAARLELDCQSLFINRFKVARPEISMHFNRRAYRRVREAFKFRNMCAMSHLPLFSREHFFAPFVLSFVLFVSSWLKNP